MGTKKLFLLSLNLAITVIAIIYFYLLIQHVIIHGIKSF